MEDISDRYTDEKVEYISLTMTAETNLLSSTLYLILCAFLGITLSLPSPIMNIMWLIFIAAVVTKSIMKIVDDIKIKYNQYRINQMLRDD